MALSNGSVIQGASAQVRANGILVAYATGINANITLSAQQIKVLGSMISQQVVHTGVDVSFSVETFRLYNDSALAASLFPRGNTQAILDFPYLDWELIDRSNGAPIQRFLKSKPTAMSIQVAQGSIMGQNMTFAACTYGDELAEQIEPAIQ